MLSVSSCLCFRSLYMQFSFLHSTRMWIFNGFFIWYTGQSKMKKKKQTNNCKGRGTFSSLSVHMLILSSCKCGSPICLSKRLIFLSVSILIPWAAPLMGYWLLCYVSFIISFYPLLLWCILTHFWRGFGALQGLLEWDHTKFKLT